MPDGPVAVAAVAGPTEVVEVVAEVAADGTNDLWNRHRTLPIKPICPHNN